MRYTFTAAALVSLAVGSIAGHAHMHHHLHAREAEAIAEPEPTEYSWSNGQCFGTWGCLSSTAAAQPTGEVKVAAAPSQPTSSVVKNGGGAQAGAGVQTPASSPTPVANSGSNSASNDVLSALTKQGMLAPAADASVISTSKSSSCTNEVTISNKSGKPMLWVCWGAAASWVNAKPALIAQPIADGSSSTLYFADTAAYQQGPGCAPAFAGTPMVNGQIKNTWVEATFSSTPGFAVADVSKEVTMSGDAITLTTGSCTSSNTQCRFECTNGADTCGSAGSYQVVDNGTPGCQGAGTANGGCTISGAINISVS